MSEDHSYSRHSIYNLTKRLGKSWRDLANVADIPGHVQDQFRSGHEASDIWDWLESRRELARLPEYLKIIERPDLIEALVSSSAPSSTDRAPAAGSIDAGQFDAGRFDVGPIDAGRFGSGSSGWPDVSVIRVSADLVQVWNACMPRRRSRDAFGDFAVDGFGYQIHADLLRALRHSAGDTADGFPDGRDGFPDGRDEFDSINDHPMNDHPMIGHPIDGHVIDDHVVDDTGDPIEGDTDAPTGGESDDGTVVPIALTVRSTLSLSALFLALDDLYGVYESVLKDFPRIPASIRFKILFRHTYIADLDGAVARWVAAHRDPLQSAGFAALVSVVRERDRLSDLIGLISRRFAIVDPLKIVRWWCGQLLSGGVDQVDIDAELRRVAGDREPSYVVLTGDDREPRSVDRHPNGYLVGEQPRVVHLSRGYFARNENRLTEVENAFWDTYQELASGDSMLTRTRVPVLWISGPSGAGKSVLLLQFLARLNTRPGCSVLSLGNPESIGETVDYARNASKGRTVFIGADDPYSPTYRDAPAVWRGYFRSLVDLREIGDIARIPILVCCGTRNQMQSFVDDHEADLRLQEFHVAPPSDMDVARLGEWFLERTGLQPETTGGGNALPAQIFFQWWKREGIREFAGRFRTRLIDRADAGDGLRLEDFVDRVIALNRIYVGYPIAACERLSDDAREALDGLEADLHFQQVEGRKSTGRQGYWLSHPHLANILFTVWHDPATKRRRRLGILRDAFLDAVRCDEHGLGHTPVLNALLALDVDASDADPDTTRLEPDDVRAIVTAASEVVCDRVTGLGVPALVSWLRAEMLLTGAVTGWSPLREALRRAGDGIAQLDEAERLLTALIRTGDRQAGEAVLRCLSEDLDWRPWPRLMSLFVTHFPDVPIESILRAGLATRPNSERVELLDDALRRRGPDPDLVAAARETLAQPKITLTRSRLAATLFRYSLDDRAMVGEWVLGWKNKPEVGPAFASLMRTNMEIYDAARGWALQNAGAPGSEAILGTLISQSNVTDKVIDAVGRYLIARKDADSADLRTAAYRWLRDNESAPAWTYMWRAVARGQAQDERERDVGLGWLERHTDVPGWAGVFALLATSTTEPDPRLTRLGASWLADQEPSDQWAVVLLSYLRLCAPEDLGGYLDQALTWLSGHHDSGSWGYLYMACLPYSDPARAERFVTIGIGWLRDSVEDETRSKPWSYVWRATHASEYVTDGDGLSDVAYRWLGSDHPGWAYVFRDYFRDRVAGGLDGADGLDGGGDGADGDGDGSGPGARDALDIALAWLTANRQAHSWPAVFGSVAAYLPRAVLSEQLAGRLREGRGLDREVGYLMKVVVEDGLYPEILGDPDFYQALLAWLRASGAAGTWWHVWSWALSTDPGNEELVEVALTAQVKRERTYGIINRLTRGVDANPGLGAALAAVLPRTMDSPLWLPLWRSLAGLENGRAQRSVGRHLLDTGGETDLWPRVWTELWDAGDVLYRRSVLERRGAAWCPGHVENPYWPDVWTRLVPFASGDVSALLAVGRAWLDAYRDTGDAETVARIEQTLDR